jgi:hypothetical protein
MQNHDFTSTFFVEETPGEVFTAINNPRRWWSEEITGSTDEVDKVFNYHFEDIHECKLKVLELVPGKKVVWHILDNNFKFIKDKTEWINTKVVFDIAEEGGRTKMVFTHVGLVPEYECYDVCYQGWTHYIQTSLKNYISIGEGNPNRSGVPQTETEKKLSSW